MSELREQTFEQNGYHLHIIKTKKFKTNVLVIRFLSPLRKETATKRALIPFVLQKGTKQLPSERLLRSKLDQLYGAQLNIDSSKKGENHLITLRINFVNEKFLPSGESLTGEVLHLVRQILLEPNADQNAFSKEVVEKEKNTLQEKIKSVKDQKMSYANMRLIDEMCKGEAYETHVHGYLDDINDINEKNLFEEYTKMLANDRMDIYVLGDVETEDIKDLISQNFSFNRDAQSQPAVINAPRENKEPKEIIEPDKVQQGKLHIGFRTYSTYSSDDYFALQVFNGLFGGFPHSKLFTNVREKHQLAYYASSRIESHKGLLLVFSGIAPSSFKKAKKIILDQLEEMEKGEFTEKQVEETKRLTIHQLKETLDNPYGIVELMYHQVLANKSISPNEMFEKINKVTKEDLINIAKKLQLDTIYFLTSEGDKHEDN